MNLSAMFSSWSVPAHVCAIKVEIMLVCGQAGCAAHRHDGSRWCAAAHGAPADNISAKNGLALQYKHYEVLFSTPARSCWARPLTFKHLQRPADDILISVPEDASPVGVDTCHFLHRRTRRDVLLTNWSRLSEGPPPRRASWLAGSSLQYAWRQLSPVRGC